MTIVPNSQISCSVMQIMEKTLQELYKITEIESEDNNAKEIMVLINGFTIGIILKLRDKVETLEPGLGDQLLTTVNEITKKDSTVRDDIKEIVLNNPLKNSISGIGPDDLSTAVCFLVSKLFDDIEMHLNELPVLLRNKTILLYSLSIIVAHLFEDFGHNNLDALIEDFSENIRLASKDMQGGVLEQICH